MEFLYNKGYDDETSVKQLLNAAAEKLLPLLTEEEQRQVSGGTLELKQKGQ